MDDPIEKYAANISIGKRVREQTIRQATRTGRTPLLERWLQAECVPNMQVGWESLSNGHSFFPDQGARLEAQRRPLLQYCSGGEFQKFLESIIAQHWGSRIPFSRERNFLHGRSRGA